MLLYCSHINIVFHNYHSYWIRLYHVWVIQNTWVSSFKVNIEASVVLQALVAWFKYIGLCHKQSYYFLCLSPLSSSCATPWKSLWSSFYLLIFGIIYIKFLCCMYPFTTRTFTTLIIILFCRWERISDTKIFSSLLSEFEMFFPYKLGFL